MGTVKTPPRSRAEERERTRAVLARLAELDRAANDQDVRVGGHATRQPAPEGPTPEPTPGYRRIEWVGEASPFDNPNVALKLAAGHYTPLQAATIRAYHHKRIKRTPGHNREMTKDRDGFSQDWVWGPKARTYVRLLPNRDADRLLSGASGPEFRDRDAHPTDPPLVVPRSDIRLVSETEFDAYTRSFGRPEFHVAGTGWGDD